MYHPSQLQSSILLLSTISLYHIVMLIILLYYIAILKEINLFVKAAYSVTKDIFRKILFSF